MKHVFIYSGNWSPRSVIPTSDSYTSSEANRDMGVAIHNADDIAEFVKTQVWDKDREIAAAWELPIGIFQPTFEEAEVVSGTVTLSAILIGITSATISYRFNEDAFTNLGIANSFMLEYDTNQLSNGITTFEVKAKTSFGTFIDKTTFNIVNKPDAENFRVLITEILPDPDIVSDSQGEFIELTNNYPFDFLLEDWQLGTQDNLLKFPEDYRISAFSSILVARNIEGLKLGYNVEADFQLSISLVNTGQTIVFKNTKGEYVDVITYGNKIAPDNSETVTIPNSGQSIQREPLHIDTNKLSDFIFSTPNPKAEVPKVNPNLDSSSTSLSSPSTSPTTENKASTNKRANIFVFGAFIFFIAVLIKAKKKGQK